MINIRKFKIKDQSIEDICSFLAGRIRAERRRNGFTQEQMAMKAGISLTTYKRFEYTGRGTLESLIRVLRVLDRLRVLELFLPSPVISRPSLITRFNELAKAAIQKEK